MQYGIINDLGHLRTAEVTEESQKQQLIANGWKPVDSIDTSKTLVEDGFYVMVLPYDAGERISFRYERVVDKQYLQREIAALKEDLSGSDYKITKCYEASLLGEQLPYDIADLHAKRQEIRDKINEIEAKL